MVWVPQNELLDNRKVFCVIRDPLDRVVSGYKEVVKLWRMGVTEHTFRDVGSSKNDILSDDIETSFRSYMETLTSGLFDNHNLPQVDYLSGLISGSKNPYVRDITSITNFIRFNHLSEDLSKLIGKPLNLPKVNGGVNVDMNIIQPILNDFMGDINSMYSDDFKLWMVDNIK
jgi:hypothetical protein